MNQISIASPCTGVCKIDDATGWCLGCARSFEEIDQWRDSAPSLREYVWDQIPNRLESLGVACRRLPWTTQDIREFVISSLESGGGTWVMGVVGGVAEYSSPTGTSPAVELTGDRIAAKTQYGAIAMLVNDDIRALTFDPPGTPDKECRILLAVKRERGRWPLSLGIADLGRDGASLNADDPGDLVDLGLGRKEARFCVRVQDGDMKRALANLSGRTLLEALSIVAPALIAESPTRVVETSLGRIEVYGRIPSVNERSPAGPHTHLLPDQLTTNRALPVGMDLPRAYLPGAVFDPRA